MTRDQLLRVMEEQRENFNRPIDLFTLDHKTTDMILDVVKRQLLNTVVDSLRKDTPMSDNDLGKIEGITITLDLLKSIESEIRPLSKEIKEQAQKAIKDLMNNIMIDEKLKGEDE
jgi:hypothetical protein